MFKDYARLTVFFCCVLIGVQIPGVLTLYQQRLDAHLNEAQQALGGFEQTARRHFNGDLDALVRHYRNSPDVVFRQDADSVAAIVERVSMLTEEQRAMAAGQLAQLWHLISFADPQLRQDTLDNYRYQVLLTPTAIGWGIGIALLLSVVVELLMTLLLPRRRERRTATLR
ncbi:DUF2937 family protein [Ferrimonas balearica]|uniref:DUF2937 family protein n=1 Tax=Ferrimonas balearica TaxID=44012 RepID=UPI001C98FD45|nr:DUF2937 family protein [Ferrimonas balearica]MBY5921571.1 DUF2937 family protein [Ferrimonas balearica]MBY5995089.1 DUF2937 family protein [Ferrimonas balearica]